MACHFCDGVQQAMERIASAMELAVRDRQALLREVEAAKRQARWSDERRDWLVDKCSQLERSNAALRGVITRMRKRIADLKAER